jgi:hypothetical protein
MNIRSLGKWRYLIYLLHASLLVIVSLWMQQLLFLYKDESTIIRLSTFGKMMLGPDQKPDPESFLFINTSYDNELALVFDETGFIPLGNRPITDRTRLAELADIIHQNPQHKYLILDIFFEQSTPMDSTLEYLLANTPRTIAGYFLDDQNKKVRPSLNIPTGAVTVRVLNDEFTKFKLSFGDSLFSLPLATYLNFSNSTYEHGDVISWINDKPVLNNFFLDYRINTFDLLIDKQYPMINLGELLMLGPENIAELVNDRWIVVGDFVANDNIETLFGSIPGPLLLMNAILALEKRDMQISILYIGFLLLCFYLISTIVLDPKDVIGQFIHKIRIGELFQNFLKGISLMVILSAVSVFSFLIFHIHVNILLLSVYLYAMDYGVIRYNARHQ